MFGLMRFDVCFSTYLRRYLRNTLRMWQVQYVTDFGYSIGETKWDAEREKPCINTYAHASASQICLQNPLRAAAKFSDG